MKFYLILSLVAVSFSSWSANGPLKGCREHPSKPMDEFHSTYSRPIGSALNNNRPRRGELSSANGKILVKNSQPNIIYDGPSPVLALMCNIEHSNPTEIKYVKSIGSEPKGLVLFPLACAMVEAAEIIELVPMCNNGKCEEIKILKKCGNEWRPYNQDEIWYTYVKNYLNLGRPDIFYNVPYWLKITKKTEKKLQTVLDVREPYSISICNANNIDIVFEGEDGTLVKYRGGTRCFKIESKFIQIDTSTAKIGSKVEMKLNYKI